MWNSLVILKYRQGHRHSHHVKAVARPCTMYVKWSEDSERKKRKSPFTTTTLSSDAPSPANPRYMKRWLFFIREPSWSYGERIRLRSGLLWSGSREPLLRSRLRLWCSVLLRSRPLVGQLPLRVHRAVVMAACMVASARVWAVADNQQQIQSYDDQDIITIGLFASHLDRLMIMCNLTMSFATITIRHLHRGA